MLAYVVKGPLRIFNFKYEPDIYTQEISQQICVYMKYLAYTFDGLSVIVNYLRYGTSSIFFCFVRTMGGLVEKPAIMAGCICHRQWPPRDDGDGATGIGTNNLCPRGIALAARMGSPAAVFFNSRLLPEVRRLIESGRSDAADELMTGEAGPAIGCYGSRTALAFIPHPF